MKIQLTHPILREIFSQLRFVSAAQQKKYLTAAEKLMLIADSAREYPVDFVIFRITGKRLTGPSQDELISGRQLIADLRVFISYVSEKLEIPAAGQEEPIRTVEDLCGQFNVSKKTIRRWQKRGLTGRIYQFEDGRKRLGFSESAVRTFQNSHPELIRRAGQFSQLNNSEKRQIIETAKQIRSEIPGRSRRPVIEAVANHTGRSRETVRIILLEHDQKNPDHKIFERPYRRLNRRDKVLLCRLYQQGAGYRELTERFGMTRTSIHRIMNQKRAEDLAGLKLNFVDSPEFYLPDAELVILETSRQLIGEFSNHTTGILSRQKESNLFRCYNFLKYLAVQEMREIRAAHPSTRRLDLIETYLQQAETIKNILVEMNMPLVVSIAGRHLRSGTALNELVSEGNISMIHAVEKFDYTRGYRFSTYASWVIAKDFARKIPAEASRPDRAQGSELDDYALEDQQSDLANVLAIEQAQHSLREIIQQELDERERFVVLNRFPLGEGVIPAKPKTLKEIGDFLGLSKERVRQIELQALQKLRHSLSPRQFDLLTGE